MYDHCSYIILPEGNLRKYKMNGLLVIANYTKHCDRVFKQGHKLSPLEQWQSFMMVQLELHWYLPFSVLSPVSFWRNYVQ